MQSFPYTFEPLGNGLRLCISREHTFGTDAFLLARFAAPRQGSLVCDLGSGCGILPLLWLGKTENAPRAVYALELQPQGVAQMTISLRENSLEGRFFPLEGDLCHLDRLKGTLPFGRFDLVTCNPPYYRSGAGLPASNISRQTAREEISCTLEDICQAARRLLRFGGRFCLCHRPERLPDLLAALRSTKLEPKRLRFVHQRTTSSPWLVLAEGRLGGKACLQVEAPLIIEACNGVFSREIQEIYR